MDQQIELGAAIGTRTLSSPAEAVAGRAPYLEVLSQLHRVLRPRLYFEIGVRLGKSLSLAMGDAVGVDPNFAISFQLSAPTRIYKMTSDDFFRDQASSVLKATIDFAFIDGQHWFEFALRDFMNIERHSSPFSAVVLDDIFPNHPIQAARERQTSYWTGDIWKIVPCLRRFRPDLTLVALDTSPTGLLLVLNLSPRNSVLSDRYDEIVRTYNPETELQPGQEVLARIDAVDPKDSAIFAELEQLRIARERGTISTARHAIQQIHSRIRRTPGTAEPDTY